MAIEDNNPERRNLTVTSLAFIVFASAGGYIPENEVHFQFVNVSFAFPEILEYFAWTIIFWFAFRYWQTSNNDRIKISKENFQNASRYRGLPILFIWYLDRYIRASGLDKNRYFLRFDTNEPKRRLTLIVNTIDDGQTKIKVEGVARKIIVVSLIEVFTKIYFPHYISHVFPYILFYSAVASNSIRALM